MPPFTEDERARELTRIMRAYGDGIKRLCRVYLASRDAAEDAAQETFIKAYEHIDKLLSGEIANEKAWLARIAVNNCRSVLRSPLTRLFDRRRSIEELPLAAPPAGDDRLALTQAVMALPVKYRELILLHYYQDINLRACANILGISAATASRRLAKAQEALRDSLERG